MTDSVFKINDAGEDYIEQDPQDRTDYFLNWTDYLGTDTIVSSVWSPSSPAGLTLDGGLNTTTQTSIFISGGVAGQVYKVTNHITTAGGRQKDRSFNAVIRQN